MTKQDVVDILLAKKRVRMRERGEAWAPSNIALCKYWGKRDEALNLPMNPSLSVSLGELGTRTVVTPLNERHDVVVLNGRELDPNSPFALRVSSYLDLVRPEAHFSFLVETTNTVPTGAGVASSASGFAALAKALNELFGWGLTRRELSVLARLGSGSACRSVGSGFVEWVMGHRRDGLDSYGRVLRDTWPGLRLGLIPVSSRPKSVSSRAGMKQTVGTSALYEAWPKKARRDLRDLKEAIRQRDFARLGQIAENNALAMHGTMLAAWPPLVYFSGETLRVLQSVWDLRASGIPVYATLDAGPNPVLLFESDQEGVVREAFPAATVVAPFEEKLDASRPG